MGNFLSSICHEKPRTWDFLVAQVEFSYSISIYIVIEKSPFTIVYTKVPNHFVDIATLPKVTEFSVAVAELTYDVPHVHDDARDKLEKKYTRVKEVVD